MEKIDIPVETYLKSIRRPPTTLTCEKSEWAESPYQPNPKCRACKGAGFLHPGTEQRIDFSHVIVCREPGCLRDSVKGKVVDEVAKQTFETFRKVKGTEEALKAAKLLASGESKFVWLMIYGGTGNGKTHLCNAIIRQVRDRGAEVRMILAADLFSLLREAIRDNKTDTLLRRFKDIFFLAIDDYGVEYGSDWEKAKFDELMTSRFATAKPTVLITNKDVLELPERIASRFNDRIMARACHNTAPDYRRTRK